MRIKITSIIIVVSLLVASFTIAANKAPGVRGSEPLKGFDEFAPLVNGNMPLRAYPSLTITGSGTDLDWVTHDLNFVTYTSVNILCHYCHVLNVVVIGSVSHGIRIGNWDYAQNIQAYFVWLSNFLIVDSTTEGFANNKWGSCLKVETNAHDILMEDGFVNRCGGEAVGITGADRVTARRVNVSNGLKANWYVDNSNDVTIEDSVIICDNSLYYRDKVKPNAPLTIADEDYDQTDNASKLGNIKFNHNLSYGCSAPFYWGGQVEPNGIDGLDLTLNEFHNMKGTIWIASGERHRNIVISPNLYITDPVLITPTPNAGTPVAITIVPTNSRTATITPSSTRTSTVTVTRTITPTRTASPTVTRTPSPSPTAAGPLCARVIWPNLLNVRPQASMFNMAFLVNISPNAIVPVEAIITNTEGMWGRINDRMFFAMKLNSNGKIYAEKYPCN